MAKHTKGPWAVDPVRAQVVCQKLDRFGGPCPVAQMLWPTPERGQEETYANATLISRAPDMITFIGDIARMTADSDPDAISVEHDDDSEVLERLILKAREIALAAETL